MAYMGYADNDIIGKRFMGQYMGDLPGLLATVQGDINAGITDYNRINNDITAAGAANAAQINGLTGNTLLLIGGIVVLLLFLRR